MSESSPVDKSAADHKLDCSTWKELRALADQMRDNLRTEQEMHAAWRKRATEAEADIERLRLSATAEAKRMDWLERNHTLHNSVAIVYVVDGYEVQLSTQDGNAMVAETHGATLREAIDKCMEEVP